jgi:hypothetical protein
MLERMRKMGTTRLGHAVVSTVLLTVGGSAHVWATQGMTPTDAVSAYAAAWAEPDEAMRRTLLEKAWTDDGVYTDPTAHLEGRDALLSHIGGFLAQMGEARLERSSAVDVHHGVLRFEWRIVAPDGSVVTAGFDYGELADDGRLRKIVGFFGPFPALE